MSGIFTQSPANRHRYGVVVFVGIGAGIIANICVHYITFPALGLTPPVAEWPLYEHISELVGHIFWFWTIEVIRRDLRNRLTGEPDAEIPLA